jgi:hypothetical protein
MWEDKVSKVPLQMAPILSLHSMDFVFCVLFARDSLWLCALNSATSFVAGFAVFSILGFMAHQQDVTMDNVVESGTQSVWFSFMACIASPC